MKFYDEDTLKQIKSKLDIVDIINETAPLHGGNGRYYCRCPFCKTNNFAVSQKRQLFYCAECNESGDVFSFVMKTKGLSLNESAELLARKADLSISPKDDVTDEHIMLFNANKEAAKYYYYFLKSKQGAEGLNYLKNERGLDDRTITRFGLGYAGTRNELKAFLTGKGYTEQQLYRAGLLSCNSGKFYDRFRGRVMCPIMSDDGKVRGFSGRLVRANNKAPKYLNSPETLIFDKKRNLFGINLAKTENGVIVCEGNLDVITMHASGINNAVAPLGTAFSEEQVAILKEYTDTVHLMMDNDEPGEEATAKAILLLQNNNMNVDVIDLFPYKDPDEFVKVCGADRLKKRIHAPINATAYEVRHWTKDETFSKRKASDLVAKHLSSASESLINEYETEINCVLNEEPTIGETWFEQLEI